MTDWRETLLDDLRARRLIRLRKDSTFCFECHPDCMGRCCNRADITLDPWDVENIARGLKLTNADFVEQYGELYLERETNWPTVRLRHAAGGPCAFLLEDGRCRIYPFRPRNCRCYPVGRSIAIGPAHADGHQPVKTDYFMIPTRDFCLGPAAGRTRTLTEWLEDSGCGDFFRLSEAHLRVKALAGDLGYARWNPDAPPLLLSLFLYEPDLVREEFGIPADEVDDRTLYLRRMEALKFLLINLAARHGRRLAPGTAGTETDAVCAIDKAQKSMLDLMLDFLHGRGW